MVKSGIKEAAIGVVGDGIKQAVDGEFDVKEIAANAGKNFISGSLNGAFNASCFAAGTMIETADGDRPIEEIQIGDLVLSANPETGEVSYKPVVNTYVHVTDTVLYLTIDGETIETTREHPFWVEGQGWTSAELLQPGDVVRLKDSSNLDVDDVEVVELPEGEYTAVYNFEVADFHTYYVSDFDVLVHNKCTEPTRKEAFNQAKRDANIPRSQQPLKVERVKMTSSLSEGGHAIKNSKGKVITTREYHFKNRNGDPIIIQDHSAGHVKGGQGTHFNVRPINNSRTGKVTGTKSHYPFRKK